MKITTILLDKRIVYKTQTSYRLNRLKLESIGISSEEMLFISLRDENSPLIKHTKSYQLIPVCKLCSSNTEFVSWNKGYKNYCSDECRVYIRTKTMQNRTAEQKLATNNKRKQTKLERYGDENFNNPEKIVETQNKLYGGVFNLQKSKQTKLERYGDENFNNTEKREKTNMEKYGVISPLCLEEVQVLSKNAIFDKYGSFCAQNSVEVQNKTNQTFISKYGVTFYNNPSSISKSHKNRTKEEKLEALTKKKNTCLIKYGDENFINDKKRRETWLSKYGVENYSQTGLNETSGYRWKEYKLPSGKIIKFQGYEDKLLDELLEDYNEDDIIISRKYMPEFWYKDAEGKNHRYFPDVYIPKTNTIYEVKSEYTLNINLEINELKFQSVRDSGYNFNLKIY